jgi:ferredoxin
MKTVSLEPIDKRPQIHTEDRILDALLAERVDVLMACGGKGRCATCHVFVEGGCDRLTPKEDREIRTLNRLSNRGENSRLACQARVIGEGVQVRLPDGMYVTENKDLEDLIGMRAEKNILHPIDGSLLIPRGKIITRSFIMELADIDSDMQEIKAKETL